MNCPYCGKEIKPKPRKKIVKQWQKTDPEFITAEGIKKLIIENYPNLAKILNVARNKQKAAQSISDCIIKEGFEIGAIWEICLWVCKHEFWKNQFRAVPKLFRNDNGNTGISLKWIKRFENEMLASKPRSSKEISEAFSIFPNRRNHE